MDIINTIANNRLWNKHSVKLVWAFAILVFALIIMSIVWNAWSQSKISQANYQIQNLAPITRGNQPSYRASDITGANLFGDPTPAPVATVAPKTTLDLTLEGVLWSTDNSAGRAIIMVGKRAGELYSIGENIRGAGAKVEEIRDGEIILNRAGVLESLALIKMTESGNRQIITFVNEPITGVEENPEIQNIQPQNQQRQPVQGAASRRPTNDTTRRVRRQNFSGLDRALEKMGEL